VGVEFYLRKDMGVEPDLAPVDDRDALSDEAVAQGDADSPTRSATCAVV